MIVNNLRYKFQQYHSEMYVTIFTGSEQLGQIFCTIFLRRILSAKINCCGANSIQTPINLIIVVKD